MGNKYSGPDRLPVPDYKTYVVGDHTPELKTLEERLRKKGLKDPWIRNNVWLYNETAWGNRNRALLSLVQWLPLGLVLGAITGTYMRNKIHSSHPHGHEHHEEGHDH